MRSIAARSRVVEKTNPSRAGKYSKPLISLSRRRSAASFFWISCWALRSARRDFRISTHHQTFSSSAQCNRAFDLGQNADHLPHGVAVSITSVSEWNFTPRAQRSSSIVISRASLRNTLRIVRITEPEPFLTALKLASDLIIVGAEAPIRACREAKKLVHGDEFNSGAAGKTSQKRPEWSVWYPGQDCGTERRYELRMAGKSVTVHPGEILLEEFMRPAGISMNGLALAPSRSGRTGASGADRGSAPRAKAFNCRCRS